MPLRFGLGKGKKKEAKELNVPVQSSAASLNSIESATSRETVGNPCVYEVPKIKDQPQIHRAVWKESLSKLKAATKDAKATVINSLDKQHRTALHLVCAKGLEDFLIHLVAVCKADPNIPDREGCTPMHRLIEGGHSKCLSYLLDHGAKTDVADRKGFTPLHLAADLGDQCATEALLSEDTNINAVNESGYTALHLAAYQGHLAIVQLLLEEGADPNIQDGAGRTSLMYACSLGETEIVQALCDNDVDFELEDNAGYKAIMYAAKENHQECVEVLEQYQQRLEREAETAATPPPSPQQVSATGEQRLSPHHVLDGQPAVGFTQSPAHSYTSSQPDPETLNDSWAPSDVEESVSQKKPSLLADGINILKPAIKSESSNRSIKVVSSVTIPAIFTSKPSDDHAIKPTVTVSVERPTPVTSQSSQKDDKVTCSTVQSKTQTRTSSKVSKGDLGSSTGYPDWFSFEGYATDESENHSNISDRLREFANQPSQMTIKSVTDVSNVKKLVDEAADSSPESSTRKQQVAIPTSVASGSTHPSDPGEQPPAAPVSATPTQPSSGLGLQQSPPPPPPPDSVQSTSTTQSYSQAQQEGMPPPPPPQQLPSTTTGQAASGQGAPSPQATTSDVHPPAQSSPQQFPSGPVTTPSQQLPPVPQPVSSSAATPQQQQQQPSPPISPVLGGSSPEIPSSPDTSSYSPSHIQSLLPDDRNPVAQTHSLLPKLLSGAAKPPTSTALPGKSILVNKTTTSPRAPDYALREDKDEWTDFLTSKTETMGQTSSQIPRPSSLQHDFKDLTHPPLQSTMLSQLGGTKPQTFSSYLSDMKKLDTETNLDLGPQKKITFSTSADASYHGATSWSRPDFTPISTSTYNVINSSYTGSVPSYSSGSKYIGGTTYTGKMPTYSTVGLLNSAHSNTSPIYTSRCPVSSLYTSTDPYYTTGSALNTPYTTGGSQLYTRDVADTTYTKGMVNTTYSLDSPIYTCKAPHTTYTSTSPKITSCLKKSPSFTEGGNSFTSKLDVELGLRKSFSFSSLSSPEDSPILVPDVKPRSKSPGRTPGGQGSKKTTVFANISINKSGNKDSTGENLYDISFDSSAKESPWSVRRNEASPQHARKNSRDVKESYKPVLGSPRQEKHVTMSDNVIEKRNSRSAKSQGDHKKSSSSEYSPKDEKKSRDDSARSSKKSPKSSKKHDHFCPVHGNVPLHGHSKHRAEHAHHKAAAHAHETPAVKEDSTSFTQAAGYLSNLHDDHLPHSTAAHKSSKDCEHRKEDGSQYSEESTSDMDDSTSSGGQQDHKKSQDRTKDEEPPVAGMTTYSSEEKGNSKKVSTPSSGKESERGGRTAEGERNTHKGKSDKTGGQHRERGSPEESEMSSCREEHTNRKGSSRNKSNQGRKGSSPRKKKRGDGSREKRGRRSKSRDHSRDSSRRKRTDQSRDESEDMDGGRERSRDGRSSDGTDGGSPDGSRDESSSDSRRARHRHREKSKSHGGRGSRSRSSSSQRVLVDATFSTVHKRGTSSLSESHLKGSYGHSSSVQTSLSCDPAIMMQTTTQVNDIDTETSQTTVDACQLAEEKANFSGQYEELCVSKARLEQQVLHAELEIRELRYTVRQRDETIKVNKVLHDQLRDHIKKLEGRLGREVEGRETAELKVREYEVDDRTKKLTHQQLVEEQQLLKEQLQAEMDARQLQEGLYHEQVRVFQSLQLESAKCQVYQADLEKKVDDMNKAKMKVESQLSATRSELSVLKEELDTLKHRESMNENAYEEELVQLKEQLRVSEDKCQELQHTMVEMKTAFDQNLQELQAKAQYLNDGLETETGRRKAIEEEVGRVKGDRDELYTQHQEAVTMAKDREQSLCQKLEEKIREQSVKDCELKSAREVMANQQARLESTEAQLSLVEKALKTSELEANQRSHEAASLDKTCQQLQEKICRMEEYTSGLDKRAKDTEGKLAQMTDRANGLEVEKERLMQQAEFSHRKSQELQAMVKSMQAKIDEMTTMAQLDRDKIQDLQGKFMSEQSQRAIVEENRSEAKRELAATLGALHKSEAELRELQKKIVAMEHDVGALTNQDALNRAELGACQMRENELKKEVEHMAEMRKALEGVMSEKQEELMRLQEELLQTTTIRDKASKEAEELRNLWEAEVKTKARLTQKVLEMESALAESKAEAGTALNNEKRRVKMAFDTKKALESRLETLQAYYSNLEGEVSRLKGELRVGKVQMKKHQQKEKLMSTLQAGYEEEKAGLIREQEELKNMLDATREQLKREGEAKLQAQLTAAKAREDLDLSVSQLKQEHGEVAVKEQEVTRLTQANHQLQDEIVALKNMMADYSLCKRELDSYKKEVQEKARRELMLKLEEVNSHMDQQSHVQESLIKMHQDKEAEWRSKYNQAQDLVKQLQSQIKMDIECKNAENARLKNMLQREIQHAEKLAAQVQRSQEEVKQYKTRLNLEKNRTEQLLKASHKAANSAIVSFESEHSLHIGDHAHHKGSHSRHKSPCRSSSKPTVQDGGEYDSLLCSVRAQLDQSISKHLDATQMSAAAKEMTSTPKSRSSGLDSIQRHYHV